MTEPLIVRPLADTALIAELGSVIDPDINARALALADAIDRQRPPGVVDFVPSYTTVLITYDLEQTDGETLARDIVALYEALDEHPAVPTRDRYVSVVYGGPTGPDLADVAAHTGLSPEEVIRRHAAGVYRVACIGFSPGYGLLLGLPRELATPRRASPRVRVPEGSVAIGGGQTGVYVMETPGGWNIIGHARQKMFDLTREDPFFLRAGDTVHFVPVDRATAEAESTAAEQGATTIRPDALALAPDTGRAIEILAGGAQTSVQDLGRPGFMRLGVIPGGALDRRAFVLGNRLVGNPPGAAGLECTLVGPRLRFTADAMIAVTGGDLGARINEEDIPRWRPVAVRAGDELAFSKAAEPGGAGIRAFVAIRGGIELPEVFGSRTTDVFARFGGVEGRILRAGDVLPLGAADHDPTVLRRRLVAEPPTPDLENPLRVTLGPQEDRFTARGIETFFRAAYTVTRLSDRLGLRLEGDAVELSRGADTISEGIAAGAIQVPGNGQPILLLPTRATVGGYPKIGTAISADFDRMGQAGPGDVLRFAVVSPADAHALGLAARASYGPDAVTEHAGMWSGWSATGGENTMDGWSPAAVERLLRVARETGATRLRLDLGDPVSFRLDVERLTNAAAPAEPAPESSASAVPAAESLAAPAPEAPAAKPAGPRTITAPLLGVFYRRPSPDEPAFVEEGQPIAAGTTLGLIEVMKTYHEVTAPGAITVRAFLVGDGETVQFGQPLIELAD